jgi:thiamine biosynthesis lipoprotein
LALTAQSRSIARRELLTGLPARESPYWIRVSRRAMACRFEVTLSGEDAPLVPAAQRALAEATRLDERLSVFRHTSELASLNRSAAERPVVASVELFALLVRCQRLHAETGGAFDITSTPLSRCWGFLQRQGRVPDAEAIETARTLVGMDLVELDRQTRGVRFERLGMELNLGSIGKGYAVQRIAAELHGAGVRHALVSAGGSSARALGGRGEGWRIDVTSPAAGPRPLVRLRLRNAALATSGIGEQWVRSDEGQGRYGHVIDPRTGWPAQGLISVSVAAGDAAAADGLATAFLVGGEDLARAYCSAHPATLALLARVGVDRPVVVGSHPGVHVEEP